MILADVPGWFIRSVAITMGLAIGSFLNVVIARLPRGESIATPGSHCVCGKPIANRDNIPIVSWLLLRGRARCCGAQISPRYPLVELIGALAAWAVVEVVILRSPPGSPIAPLVGRAVADAFLAWALIAAAFIDLDHMYLPDPITLGGTVFAFVTTIVFRPEIGWRGAAIGVAAGFLGIYVPFVVLYRLLRGRQGMGLGDAKLLALVGAWLGLRGVVFALFAGSIQGTLAAIVIYARHGKIEEPASVTEEREAALAEGEPLDPDSDPVALPPEPGLGGARIAFGPFLILGALEQLLFAPFIERFVIRFLDL